MTDYLRKRIVTVVFILAAGVCLISCAKTPEKKVVVDKSKGLSKESIIPKEKNTPKDLGVPVYWQETIEKNDGFVVLTADYKMQIPKIYNTPVYSYERVEMTDKLLKKLCQYFADGDKLYENPPMTKSELVKEKDKMAGYKGLWGRYTGIHGADLKKVEADVD